ncbi:hypothetical protein KPL71_017463 [Citrus sinensis]|uniref:Uncharacterized protein n=1 Tax=Citrus sinensis TaxID=2711 RepID=A0ACB8JPY8_CITSI|nr:hypothetical protein KPL71_017463 [Citrus sinensis]
MGIPSDLIANWKREGYTHLHLRGVRIILTLHGRKGLPVTARISLLDTRFKQYQHAVVGTVLTTLHAGSVLLTFYPNFNLSLEDPNLLTTLKVQIQLQGAEQTPTSKIATLHHQIVYRLQNHALDLPTLYTTSDALMILADTDTSPTIIQIPKQIQKQELLKLMPLEWLTNYEHFHQNSEPIQTTEATFDRRPNGQVKLSFQTPDTNPVSDSPQLSYTAMITVVQTGQEKKLPIHDFSSEGYPVYPDKINGHFIWDVPEAHMCNPDCPCLDDTDIDEELKVMRRKKKKKKKSSYPPSSCKSFPPQPPPDPKPLVHPIRYCLMFSSHSYEESFPPLEKHTDTQTRVTSKPFVQSPVTASGQPEKPKQYEAVLNWQTKNASAQNQTLQQLGKKIDRVASHVSQTETKVDSISSRLDQMYIHLQDRISELDTDLRRMINNHIWGPEFNKKEAEIRKLKAELTRIDAEKTRPSLFTQPQPTPVSPLFFETYTPFYTPSRPQQLVYNQFFGFSHLQPTPQLSSPRKSKSKVKISEPHPKSSSNSSTTSDGTSTDSESEYVDITGILMATETADAASWFAFDDIPRHKWSARLQEFATWIDLQEQLAQDAQIAFLIAESSDSEDISVIATIQIVNYVSTIPRPSLKMSILPSKFHKPVPVIGFIDTGADTNDQYQPGPHIAVELLKFPDTYLNRKYIQQFLGIVNYVRDFIPKVAFHTSQLSCMLKKQCPPWGPAQTEAIKQLKVIVQSPPPLRIPTNGYRILQTEVSDDYWSAILLEEINGVGHFCAHASRQFKDSKKNYHVIYKEILAVKIFDFKNKLLPDKQLLNLKTWFAKYDFTVQYIKGNQNLIPDFLTRPAINKPSLISSIQTIPVIAMNRQLPFKALNQRNFPMNISLSNRLTSCRILQRNSFTGLTLSSLSICEDELWYMWCLTALYATKLVLPIKPILTHLTTPEFSPDLLWTLLEWYSLLTWWRKQLQQLITFHGLEKMPEQEANMWTTVFIVHRPYFQHPETRDYWTQDMAYEWRTYPHPYTLIHDTFVTSVLKAYLMELNNVPSPATDIHHTSIGPSHTLEIIPKTQGCTPGSSSSPQGILVMEQRPVYTNVLFQDAQDPWEGFQSLLHTENPRYTVTAPDSPTASTSQHMTEANEAKYQQTEVYLDQRQIHRHKRQYEKDTGDLSPSRYPSTP